MEVSVLKTGAVGDGVTLDTAAVQKAVDMCGEAGGGVVTFPAGKYILGKVNLKSHITISLESGAHIIASSNEEDYPYSYGPKGAHLECRPGEGERSLSARCAIFYGCNLIDVAFKGPGEIDGNYLNILVPRKNMEAPSWAVYEKDLELYTSNGFRPALVMLEKCENVRFENIYLHDASIYTMSMYSCKHMHFHGVRINNALGADNSDGIHFISCLDVFMSDCDLFCGDDAIAIDTDEGGVAERFVITNCILASRNNCIRIFHSLHNAEMYSKLSYCRVRNIVISSCVIRQGDSVVSINADKGEISNVIITNITGDLTRNGGAFVITSHNGSKVDGVTFSNWSLKCRGAGYMYAEPGSTITNVTVKDYSVEVCPKTQLFCMGMDKVIKAKEGPLKDLPFYWWSHNVPFFMQIVSAGIINLDNIRIYWGEETLSDLEDMYNPEGRKYIEWVENEHNYPTIHKPTRDWPAIRIDNVEELYTNRLQLTPHGNCPDEIVIYKDGKRV